MFSLLQLKPLERPSQDAAFPHLTLGCGSVDGSSDAPARGSRAYPCPYGFATRYGGCATPSRGDLRVANRTDTALLLPEQPQSPSAHQGPGHLHAETCLEVRFPGGVVRVRFPFDLGMSLDRHT